VLGRTGGCLVAAAVFCAPGSVSAQGPGVTGIHAVQGDGAASPLVGQLVTIEGIVVGDFQDALGTHGDLDGFFLQEEDADADANPATSEGIFVSGVSDVGAALPDVMPGDLLSLTGTVEEVFGLTTIATVSAFTILSSDNALPTPATVSLPADLERYEGMSIVMSQTLVVTEMFNLDRFGQLTLFAGDRPLHYTQNNAPSVSGYAAHLADIAAKSILLDDGSDVQNPDPVVYPDGELDGDDAFRMGHTTTGVSGVLTYSFGDYRIHPTADSPIFEPANSRPAGPPDVGGTLRLAAFNVLNFFLTIDDLPQECGPALNVGCRGADSAVEFERQVDKLRASLLKLDADIVGLVELENTTAVAVLQALVDALNAEAGAGTYSFVDTGVYGPDAIRQGLIYKPARVSPIGPYKILDASVDARYNDSRNRPTLLQTFEESTHGERFSVAVVHLKSKGSNCNALGDPDQNDGQGNCNGTRAAAAAALGDWLATDPTASGDPDFVVVGDFNSYAREDPVRALEEAGFTTATQAHTFVFAGQIGTLDYIFTSAELTAKVSASAVWHINADEPDAIDYNLDFGRPPGIYRSDEFRSSDHDPVLIGFDFSPDTAVVVPPSQPVITRIEADDQSISLSVSISDNGGAEIESIEASCTDGSSTLDGSSSRSPVRVFGVSVGASYTCTVRATNAGGFTSPSSALSAAISPEALASGLPVWLLLDAGKDR
jgi:predicted extracellular nuclease